MKLLTKSKNKRVEVLFDSSVHIYNPPASFVREAKEELTITNPNYDTVKKYSKYATTNVPPYLFYFEERANEFIVPLGSKCLASLKEYNPKVMLNRVTTNVRYPPFVLELRGSQKEASQSYLLKKNDFWSPSFSIQLPTGKGKTVLALYLAAHLQAKTLVIVHKDDLVKGWQEDIKLAFDGKVKSGLIKAQSKVVGDLITIATVQTLNRMSEEDLNKLYSTFSFVVQDEMHHAPSNSFSISSKFKAYYRLGLTATPERSDGLEHVMQLYFGDFCYRYVVSDPTLDEDILPVYVNRVEIPQSYFDPVYKKVDNRYVISRKTANSDYVLKDGEIRYSSIPYSARPQISYHTIDNFAVTDIKEQVCASIAEEYKKGHSCVVFFTQKEHCREYQQFLLNLNIPENKIGLYYGDNPDNMKVYLTALNIRKYITLTTYAKATEGTNINQWEVAFFVSSMNNGKNVEQASGRIRRTMSDGEKLNPVIIYDYRQPNVYSLSRHSITRDTRYRKLGFTLSGLNKPSSAISFTRGYK